MKPLFNSRIITFLCFILLINYSCKKEDNNNEVIPPTDLLKYNPTYIEPQILPSIIPMHNPNFNKMTVEGVKLGRTLYYDNILSTNGLSCSSCHNSQNSFTSPFLGPAGSAILPHINLGWSNAYGWNGGAGDYLDYVALGDLAEGNIFLNANSDSIDNRFARNTTYQKLFWEAFGVYIIQQTDSARNNYISFALAQFIRTMVSNNSRFDKYLRSEISLSTAELNGYNIFMDGDKGDCFHCHGNAANPLWTDLQFHNNALNDVFVGADQGRYLITGEISDLGKFKTPTLRNIALTAPYMHDNRFSTLQQVIDFYSEGLKHSAFVDPMMQKINQGGVQLTPTEKADLISFLNSLTDSSYINNPNFQAP